MSQTEINQLKKRLVLELFNLDTTTLSNVTGESFASVSHVKNDTRPCKRARAKIAAKVAEEVYLLFGVEPPARPQV